MDIETQIKQFILDNFLFGGSIDEIDAEASLINTGVIDSLGVMTLLSFVEETYGIEVADEDVVPQNFDSVRNLARYIRSKIDVPAVAD